MTSSYHHSFGGKEAGIPLPEAILGRGRHSNLVIFIHFLGGEFWAFCACGVMLCLVFLYFFEPFYTIPPTVRRPHSYHHLPPFGAMPSITIGWWVDRWWEQTFCSFHAQFEHPHHSSHCGGEEHHSGLCLPAFWAVLSAPGQGGKHCLPPKGWGRGHGTACTALGTPTPGMP